MCLSGDYDMLHVCVLYVQYGEITSHTYTCVSTIFACARKYLFQLTRPAAAPVLVQACCGLKDCIDPFPEH